MGRKTLINSGDEGEPNADFKDIAGDEGGRSKERDKDDRERPVSNADAVRIDPKSTSLSSSVRSSRVRLARRIALLFENCVSVKSGSTDLLKILDINDLEFCQPSHLLGVTKCF